MATDGTMYPSLANGSSGLEILKLWSTKPFGTVDLARTYIEETRKSGRKTPSLAETVKKVKLAKAKVLIQTPPKRKSVERFLQSDMSRGAFLHLGRRDRAIYVHNW